MISIYVFIPGVPISGIRYEITGCAKSKSGSAKVTKNMKRIKYPVVLPNVSNSNRLMKSELGRESSSKLWIMGI
jgi:hypothetical protein